MRCMTRNTFWNLTVGPLLLLAFVLVTYTTRDVRADTKPVVQMTLQNAQTTGNGTVAGASYLTQCRETAIYVVWGAGTGAGVFTIETAHDASYTGTWAPLATVTWAVVSKADVVQITGIHMAMRARISTTVTGGTASAYLVCN